MRKPVQFTSPLFKDNQGDTLNFNRVAFETNLPRTEFDTNPPCQRLISNPADPNPGSGCVDPPVGANFYPIYTTTQTSKGSCMWQLGGANIPGTTDAFGGTSTTERYPVI